MQQHRYAVFDIDGTLIRWQLYHAMADTLVKLGAIQKDEYTEVLSARMNWKNRQSINSFEDYEQSLITLIDRALPSIDHKLFVNACINVVDRYRDQVYTFTRDLIADLKRQDYLLFAISGSPEELVGRVAEYYGFDDYVGTRYVFEANRFKNRGPTMFGPAKPKKLIELINKYQAQTSGSIAVGDSAGDIGMLELAEKAIAFNPTRELLDHAIKRKWEIIIERKNV